ncbi:transaldolase [Candidatus Uhrbacteria bacterium]|nr:transaldolase [Candidatus Uhrbacteria bacterium]
MRPDNLTTKIFLDGGDPAETRAVIERLGFLDGQTTNPTLIAKNPEAQKRLARGEKFSEIEIYDFYKSVVQEMSALIPRGSISVEVYAERSTNVEQMFNNCKQMFDWIPNAHIKFPITAAGLEASERATAEDIRVNMTLCFSQQQAAAVHCATRMSKKGGVFVSPFVGRLDDIGENGMDLIKNILAMYREQQSHVEILSASIRSIDHFLASLFYGADIITAPSTILLEWADQGMPIPAKDYVYDTKNLAPILYRQISLDSDWRVLDISHPLTDKGIERFAADWNALIKA